LNAGVESPEAAPAEEDMSMPGMEGVCCA
jgi:hypothetical protein